MNNNETIIAMFTASNILDGIPWIILLFIVGFIIIV